MGVRDGRRDGSDASFEILAELTARLAATPHLDHIVGAVLEQIAALGFGMVWMAKFDEATGLLLTVKEVVDGIDATVGSPEVVLDMRRPIGHGFTERRIVNVQDPGSLYILDDDAELIPPGRLALPRDMYMHLRGSPFATGPLLGASGQPIGAIGFSAYRGGRAIPDDLFRGGLLRALVQQLAIATERALYVARLERTQADLARAQEVIVRDGGLRAVGELAAAAAHDLNNLSGVALMAVSAGRRSPLAASEALRPIERANRAMSDLIARLQRVARAGAATDGREVAAADEVVQDILVMTAPMLREHSIRVEFDAPRASPVRVDPTLLHQVLLNLVVNARDAMEAVAPDRRALRVELHEEASGVRIVVADTGPGISPQAQARLFRPFATTKGSHHLGIGLASARASLERYGAELSGRNSTAGGAIFEVRLERAERPAAAEKVEAEAPEPTAPALGTGQTQLADAPPRILVVDDDSDLVKLVGAFLEPLGYVIRTATNAPQALTLATAQVFDLILCDVAMPGRGGLDIGRELRQAGFAGKIVLMTGWDGEVIAAQEATPAYDRLLRKPFYGDDLVRAIETTLGA